MGLAKIISQVLFATFMLELIPADAAFFEWRAQAGSEAAAQLSPIERQQMHVMLPIAEKREITYPVKVDENSYGIVTTAKSVLVQDIESGKILLAKHPYDVRPIGSVTKLMSALVFLDQEPDLSRQVQLQEEDLITGGRIYLAFSDPISLRDVFASSIVGSDNTATQALVRFSGLSEEEFVRKMNEKARQFGMTSTTFTDPTGIDAGNTSTAQDIIRLLEAAENRDRIRQLMRHPEIQVRHASGRMVRIENTNKLLMSYLHRDPYSVSGGKTGYLPRAGYVLATTVRRGDDGVHVIVMGAESKEARINEAKGLAAWAFKTFRWPE